MYEKGTQQKLNKNRKINTDIEKRKGEKLSLSKYWNSCQKLVKCKRKIIANSKVEDRYLQDTRKRISVKRQERKQRLVILKVCQIQNMENNPKSNF